MGDLLDLLGDSAGWILGLGITVGVASSFSSGAKPLAKKAIKGYLTVADRVRVATAELGENLQDLYAEARMEYDSSRAAGSGTAAPSQIIVPGHETA